MSSLSCNVIIIFQWTEDRRRDEHSVNFSLSCWKGLVFNPQRCVPSPAVWSIWFFNVQTLSITQQYLQVPPSVKQISAHMLQERRKWTALKQGLAKPLVSITSMHTTSYLFIGNTDWSLLGNYHLSHELGQFFHLSLQLRIAGACRTVMDFLLFC